MVSVLEKSPWKHLAIIVTVWILGELLIFTWYKQTNQIVYLDWLLRMSASWSAWAAAIGGVKEHPTSQNRIVLKW